MEEIEELKYEVSTLKARLKSREDQTNAASGTASLPVSSNRTRSQDIDRIVAIRMGKKGEPQVETKEDPNLSDLPVVKWSWKNVEAWLKHIKASEPVIQKFTHTPQQYRKKMKVKSLPKRNKRERNF